MEKTLRIKANVFIKTLLIIFFIFHFVNQAYTWMVEQAGKQVQKTGYYSLTRNKGSDLVYVVQG